MDENAGASQTASSPRGAIRSGFSPAAVILKPQTLAAVASVVGVILLWELSTRFIIRQPIIAPGPVLVFDAFVKAASDGRLASNAWASLFRVLAGFSIACVLAVPLGFAMGWYPLVRSAVDPIVQFLRVIPPIALIPLLIIYLGIGESARIFVIAVAAFLAIIVAVYQGVGEVDPVLVRAARVMGAKDWHIFADVVAPATLPYILVGMRQGLANAWGSLVAAELIASSRGLGYMIISAQENFRVPEIIVGIITIGVIGVVMDRIVVVTQQRLTPWRRSVR